MDAKGLTKVLEIYARDWHKLPLSFTLLIIFGIVFVLAMLTLSENTVGQQITAVGFFIVFLAVLLPKRHLFTISANARRLMKFLGLSKTASNIGFCLPVFEDAEAEDKNGQVFTYSSYARDDVAAMIEIFALLAKHDLVEETRNPLDLLVRENDRACLNSDTIVHIGGPRVSLLVESLVERDLIISHELAKDDSEYAIVLKDVINRRYSIRPPSRQTNRSDDKNFDDDTFGCVMKRMNMKKPQRFAIWGLDARGTLASAHWLAVYWSQLDELFDIEEDEPFTAILRVPPRERHADPPERVELDFPDYGPLLLPSEKRNEVNVSVS